MPRRDSGLSDIQKAEVSLPHPVSGVVGNRRMEAVRWEFHGFKSAEIPGQILSCSSSRVCSSPFDADAVSPIRDPNVYSDRRGTTPPSRPDPIKLSSAEVGLQQMGAHLRKWSASPPSKAARTSFNASCPQRQARVNR